MLRSVKNLQSFEIIATDGHIGHVDQFYFDDERWAIRYLVVDTGTWLPGRRVLISPIAIDKADWIAGTLLLAITKGMVESSPDIDTRKPVSRQQEAAHFAYYGYPSYWGGAGLWGPGPYPAGLAARNAAEAQARVEAEQEEAEARGESRLRSSKEVIGYHLQATDGELGHIEDFLVDDETWAIRYIVVDTSNWWIGKHVLIAPDMIRDVSWERKHVSVDLPRQSVKDAPEYDSASHLDRQWEADYYAHYHRQPYWMPRDAGPADDTIRPGGAAGTTAPLLSLKDHGELEVAEGNRDPRGWQVVASTDGRTIGKVDDLIADPSTMKVRYLDVDLDEGALQIEARDRHILLPVDYARLEEREDSVRAEGLSAEDVKRLPVYTSLPVAPGYDERFRGIVRERGSAAGEERDQRLAEVWVIGVSGPRER